MITGRKFQGKGMTNEELGNNFLMLGSFLTIMGIIFFPFAAWSSMVYREVQKWPTAEASILRVEQRSPVHVTHSKNSTRKRIIYFVGVKYRFMHDGKSFTGYGEFGRSNSPDDPEYRAELKRLTGLQAASGTFPVVVNPKRPFESLLSRDGKVSHAGVVGGWTLTLLLLFGGPTLRLLGRFTLLRS